MQFDETIRDYRGITQCNRKVVNYGSTVAGEDGVDGNGHGTHCAGSAGGATASAAPCADVYSIQVLDAEGTGYYSDIYAAVNMVREFKEANMDQIVIASLSLGSNCYGGE